MIRGSRVSILKTQEYAGNQLSAKYMNSSNAVTLPLATSEKSYSGQSVITLNNKDNQNIVAIAFGGFVTPE